MFYDKNYERIADNDKVILSIENEEIECKVNYSNDLKSISFEPTKYYENKIEDKIYSDENCTLYYVLLVPGQNKDDSTQSMLSDNHIDNIGNKYEMCYD